MNKTIYLSIFALMVLTFTEAQTTFNHRYSLDLPRSVFTSIAITDTAYYVVGLVYDTTLNGNVMVFGQFDLTGEPVFHKILSNAEKRYRPWWSSMLETPSGNFIVNGILADSFYLKGFIMELNTNGDTIKTAEFTNPVFPAEDFIAPLGITKTKDDGYLILSNIENPFGLNLERHLIKFDQDFNFQWEKTYGDELKDHARSIISSVHGGGVIGGWKTNDHLVNYDILTQIEIFEVDSLGNKIWEYITPEEEYWYLPFDLLKTDDGGLVVATNSGWEWRFPSGPNDSLGIQMWRNTIFKLDSLHNRVWTRSFTNGWDAPVNENARIVQAPDQSGYVAVGLQFLADTTGVSAEQKFGWLTKVSEDGDSLWARYLYILEDIKHHRHQVHDLKACPDGGYVMCGEAIDQSPGGIEPRQQAWLLKVDEYGCLVPGCQGIINDVESEEAQQAQWLLYPNPASDYLNVFFRSPEVSPSGVFRIWDSQGRLMKEFKSQLPEVTLVVPLDGWPIGTYVLQYVEEGKPVLVERFVKG